jgi:hypothetical protein
MASAAQIVRRFRARLKSGIDAWFASSLFLLVHLLIRQ